MKAFLNSRELQPAHTPIIPGWKKAHSTPGHEEGRNEIVGSMTDITTIPQSPQHLFKQRRLSRLLDKLAVQINNNNNNNNNYTARQWLMFDTEHAVPPKEPEDVPLDLSVKSKQHYSPPVPKSEPFVCGTCGQSFTAHDRLAKHVASRHRNRTPDSARAYECDVCLRKFARSDMLTRHSRLHTGVKPYSCSACSQVFSRSDHLTTHQRTHTGEKPYRCSACPYAACRRDMITRHMKTHTRKSQAL